MSPEKPRIRPVRGRNIATENPLKKIRTSLDLTIDQVAYRAGVSKQFIIKSEQAVYTEPSASLVAFYGELVDLDVVEIEQEYYLFQRETRRANYGRLIEPWAFTAALGEVGHPFINWRMLSGVSSAAGLCKLFCVHPAVLNKFENRSYLIAGVPEGLVSALLEAGYSANTLDALEKAYRDFKLNEPLEVISES